MFGDVESILYHLLLLYSIYIKYKYNIYLLDFFYKKKLHQISWTLD